MGRLLKRLKVQKIKKKKVSLLISEELLERLEKVRNEINYPSKGEFVEKLLDYALSELERELNQVKKSENNEEKQEELIIPE